MDDVDLAAVVDQAARGLEANSPPPITAARPHCLACATMRSQSSMVRKPNTPGRRRPSGPLTPAMGGMKARLPVAIRSLS